jgi:hypothetical protein
MIGSGIPISQSNTPFPNDMAASRGNGDWKSNSLGFHWFHCRLSERRKPLRTR